MSSHQINSYIINFNKFLINSTQFLSEAGVVFKSDGWDDFVENNFTTLVVNPVGEETDYWIDSEYEAWPSDPIKNPIKVKVYAGNSILIGTKKNERSTKFEKIILNENIEFDFIEFGTPEAEPDDIEKQLKCASGFIKDKEYAVLLEDCDFFVG